MFWRRADVLSRGNSKGDCQAPRREDGHSRLGCVSGGIGARYLGRDLRGRGREQLNRGERWNPCGNVLFPCLRRSAFCRGGRSFCFGTAVFLARSVLRGICGGCFLRCLSPLPPLFLARPQLFPALLRKTGIVFLLGVLPLILMIFWLVRVLFTNAFKRTLSPNRVLGNRPGGPQASLAC
jgi:hypothetical protein